MKLFTSIVITSVLTAPFAVAQKLNIQPESTLSLTGDSTLHPFTSTATVLNLTGEWEDVDKDLGKALLEKNALKQLRLTIPVMGLKSKEPRLDKNMYNALKADEFSDITFELSRYDVHPSTLNTTGFRVTAEGVLKISGKEQPITLNMEATPEGSTLRAQGDYQLLMTDFGIKPPTMMMGTIKVRNPVKIQFDLRLTNSP